jgi:hypothetical protein
MESQFIAFCAVSTLKCSVEIYFFVPGIVYLRMLEKFLVSKEI